MAKLFTVHLHLVVRLTRPGRKARNASSRMRLVVCADNEDAAKRRALNWFERESAGPRMGVSFGNGLWDAQEVRLAESTKCPSIEVFDRDCDVMVLS